MAVLGAAGGVAGCLGDGGSSGGDGSDGGEDDTTATETPTEEPTATPTEKPTTTPTEAPMPTVTNETIETGLTDCMTGDQRASVSFEADRVVVNGAIQSPNPCHEAALESVEYDPDGDRLTVGVGVEDTGEGACQSCLGMVQYTAEIGFDVALPGHVTVEHVGSGGEATTITETSQ